MSHYVKCKTNIKDNAVLLSALKKAGVPEECIETSSGDTLIDYTGYGSQKGTAEIVIRRKFHSGYGDVAFSKGSDGFFSCTVDDLDDVGTLARKVGAPRFTASVNQWYSALKAQKALKMQGLSAKISRDGNKLVVLAKG